MSLIDQEGNPINVGQKAEVQIYSGEWKTGSVVQTYKGLVTVRCDVTDTNPDGVLFSAESKNTVMLIP